MIFDTDYPENYRAVLAKISNAAKDGIVSEGPQRSYFGRPAYWTYVENISLKSWVIDIDLNEGNTELVKIPSDLQEFLSGICEGNLEKAIKIFDQISDKVELRPDNTHDPELAGQLCLIGSLLRNIDTILRTNRTRPERYAPDPTCSQANPIHPYIIDSPHILVCKEDRRPAGPSKPNQFIAGFCLICHRISDPSRYYCHTHNKSTGSPSVIKASQRMINRATEYMANELSHPAQLALKRIENNKNISKNEAFRQRPLHLMGWSKKRPEHKQFAHALNDILRGFGHISANDDWPNSIVELFEKIIPLTRSHAHTEKIFHRHFLTSSTGYELKKKLTLEVFDIGPELDFSMEHSILMLERMSQFSLIKIASTKKGAARLRGFGGTQNA